MDVVEKKTTSLKKASKHWNIPLTLVSDHLYRKKRSRKTKLVSVLIAKGNQVVVFWVLAMQDVGLSISVQQLKMKVAKFTQTRLTPFQGRVLRTSLWYWFKYRHLEFNICQVQGLDISRAQ
jgi:hypothetical protein